MLKRRTFLTGCAAVAISAFSGFRTTRETSIESGLSPGSPPMDRQTALSHENFQIAPQTQPQPSQPTPRALPSLVKHLQKTKPKNRIVKRSSRAPYAGEQVAEKERILASAEPAHPTREQSELAIRDNFTDAPSVRASHDGDSVDVVLTPNQKSLMNATFARLSRLQSHIGHGNFNVVSWDDSIHYARQYSRIEAFTTAELDFIEELFSKNATAMGFYGDKIITHLSAKIKPTEIRKIPGTGHYLFRGDALNTYTKIRKDVGETVVLTSGIRSVVKQIYLFLNKAIEVEGNLSLASYSLAPPGHSYHAIGDFDVGKTGLGKKNFTDEFSKTDEFKRLSDLGYFDIRYPQNNPYGVRYEPWHIKVV